MAWCMMHALVCLRGQAYEVRDEISEETDRHLKRFSNRVVSGDPIYLTVYSPNVPNLSLVDMPGRDCIVAEGAGASEKGHARELKSA
eukprot:1136615-Pelagomonas_calceolata.AAC.6